MLPPDTNPRDALDMARAMAGDEVRGVVVRRSVLHNYTQAVAALLAALDGQELPAWLGPLIAGVLEDARMLQAWTVRLLPQHVYDLANRAPGLAAPYELWAPIVEENLRLQEERDAADAAAHTLEEERDRARETAVRIEQELAHVDRLIGAALFAIGERGDPDAQDAVRQLLDRLDAGVSS